MTPPLKPGDRYIRATVSVNESDAIPDDRWYVEADTTPTTLADDIAATAAMMRRTAERMIGDEDEGIILRGCRLTGFAMGVELWAKGLREQQ